MWVQGKKMLACVYVSERELKSLSDLFDDKTELNGNMYTYISMVIICISKIVEHQTNKM